jgi:hypothetical protein
VDIPVRVLRNIEGVSLRGRRVRGVGGKTVYSWRASSREGFFAISEPYDDHAFRSMLPFVVSRGRDSFPGGGTRTRIHRRLSL